MKKSILIVLSIALVAGTMSSCGKSSKGKMEGIWTVEGSTQKSSSTNGSSTSSNSTVINGAVVTYTDTQGSSSTTSTGVVNEATMTIGKDGTWSNKTNVTYTQTIVGTVYATNIITTTSGNWDFLDGVSDEFKGKERVAFYTLNWNETVNQSSGSSSTTTTDSEIYKNTDNSMVYVISESKKKSLMMISEGGGTSNGGTVTTTSQDYTLIQE